MEEENVKRKLLNMSQRNFKKYIIICSSVFNLHRISAIYENILP